LGYTVKKGRETYHIHSPYRKNGNDGLTPIKNEWTLETDEPRGDDLGGYLDVDNALQDGRLGVCS
jgi:hypothetical protein